MPNEGLDSGGGRATVRPDRFLERRMSEKRKLGDVGLGRGDAPLARGRSSRSNEAARCERLQTEAWDDGWAGSEDDEPSRVETTLSTEKAKTIISRNESPD